ncbi:hypothetical protein CRUP_029814 [Coryphaenoides rupestris]|nr:hypothetical protein CRUP_029814 [Coryphaenoides rupestris]
MWKAVVLVVCLLVAGIQGMGAPSYGCPPVPSLPQCHIPYEEKGGMLVRSAIHCVWDPGPPSEIPSIYTLHWESDDYSEQDVSGTNRTANIPPEVSRHAELSVWVRAKNQNCSADSPKSSFNTASIMKPATPTIKRHTVDPLEIYWESKCFKQAHCRVRHRVAPDQEVWSEENEEFHVTYFLENVHPYSVYEFQVRCVCHGSLPSDWSPVYKTSTCRECRLNATLGAVNVLAYTALGATKPARLQIPLPVQESSGEALQLKLNSEELVVSWNLSTQHINSQSEFVVQYKQAGLPPTQGFDWIRVKRSQTSATLTGQFEKYIAYQVALFSVFPNGSSDHISSAVGYVRQGIPSTVPFFEVVINKDNSVTLTWKGIPLAERRGEILCYQIGVGDQRVYNVSDENQSFLLKDLKPGQPYQAWIRAVTEAGPGPNSTREFKIYEPEPELFDYQIVFILLSCFVFILVFLVFMKYFPSWVPMEECDPVLSQVEIVEPRPEDEMTRCRTADRGSRGAAGGVANLVEWAGSGDCYSKMPDLDDEVTDTFSSDYEKHFIPTAEDIMGV